MSHGLVLSGTFHIRAVAPDGSVEEEVVRNGITDQGLTQALQNIVHVDQSNIISLYFGLISNTSFTGTSQSDTHASHSGWTEHTANIDNATRPAWSVTGQPDIPVMSNEHVSLATITFTAVVAGTTHPVDSIIRGLFLATTNTLGSTSSSFKLWSTGLFDMPRRFRPGTVLTIKYVLTALERE